MQKVRIEAQAIHGDKAQNNRQRALRDFKEGKVRVLVATDIAARGIDINKLQYVINYDIFIAACKFVKNDMFCPMSSLVWWVVQVLAVVVLVLGWL